MKEERKVEYYIAPAWRWTYRVLGFFAISIAGLALAGGGGSLGFWAAVLLAVGCAVAFMFGKGQPILAITERGITYSTGPIGSVVHYPVDEIINMRDSGRGVLIELKGRKRRVNLSTSLLAGAEREPAKKTLLEWFSLR